MCALKVSDAKIDLRSAVVMLIDPREHSMTVLSQILMGFEVNAPLKYARPEDALETLKSTAVDLILVEADMPGMDGYAFTRALRHSRLEPNRYAPVIIMSGHTPRNKVEHARDCGANILLVKPLNPQTVLKRIIWIAQSNRAFIETEDYVGPERRFHRLGALAGGQGRRKDDLPAEIGEASSPNLSQDDIDSLITPQRVNL
jgi:CheY-like chemotaxis protein